MNRIFKSTTGKLLGTIGAIAWGTACAGYVWNTRRPTAVAPELNGLKPVKFVDVNRYMGLWFEQRRIEAAFEKGLDSVTAQYSLTPDDTIAVCNMGVKQSDKKFSIATATARFTQHVGVLMVAFVTFIEGPYVILYVDDNYKTAVVGSPTRKYLWLLTRNRQVVPEQIRILRNVALDNGYTLEQLDNLVEGHHIG